jgi:putative phosphoribosyl transferase
MVMFSNRTEAGRQLASALKPFIFSRGVVLAIPRGGVVVGYKIAEALNLPLDVIIPRKIGAPDNPELAIGAVTEDGTIVRDNQLIAYLGISEDYIEAESQRQRLEIARRMKVYRQNQPYPNFEGRDVIIVDDGIATGSTMKAALASIQKKKAKAVTVAIPVGPPSTIDDLKQRADRVICLFTPEPFSAIGEFYADFNQTEDDEVIDLLQKNRQKHPLSESEVKKHV